MLRWTKNKKEEESAAVPPAAKTPPAEAGSAGPAVHARTERTEPPAAAAPPLDGPAMQKSLPELLLAQGKITREQLDAALARQKETGEFIGEILTEQGVIDENSLISFLAKYCKVPHLSLLDYLIDKDIVELIPQEICLKYRVLPIDKIGRNLTVAMVNPLNTEALDKVRELCPDLRIKPILCAYNHFEVVTSRLFCGKKSGGMVELSATALGFHSPAAKPKPAAVHDPPVAPAPEKSTVYEPSVPPPPELPAASDFEDIPEALVYEEPAATSAETSATAPPDEREVILTEVFHPAEPADAPTAAEAPEDAEASALMKEMASVMMDSMRDTYAMLARRMELFRGLSPEDVARIFARGITIEYQAGQKIFEKGQSASEMYVILGGEVKISDGERELAVLRRGDMFGEMAVVSRQPRSASAEASEVTSVLSLSMDIINHVMPKEVAVRLLTNIVVTLSARLRRANETWAPPSA